MEIEHFANYRIWDGKHIASLMDIALPIDVLEEIAVSDPHSPIEGPHVHLWDVLLDVCKQSDIIILRPIGIKDKDGTEVFEGDIVRCSSGCPHEVVWLDEVPGENWGGGGMPGFYLQGLNSGYAWTETEKVIGNVYEHPELLKESAS